MNVSTLPRIAYSLLINFTLLGVNAFAVDIDYERQIAPLLKTYCAGCHNDTDKEGDLSLLTLNALRTGTPDGAVVVAAKPEESKLFKVISGSAEPKMPPKDEPQLKPDQIALIREWIAQGAKGDSKPSELMSRLIAPKLAKDPKGGERVSAACSAGADRTAIGKFGTVEVRNSSGQVIWIVDQLPGKVNQLRQSPDGKSLVVATGVTGVAGEVLLLNIENGQVQQRFQGHSDAAYCASASADAKWIASGSYDKSIIVWDRTTGKPALTLTGHNGAIYDLDFDATSSLIATASADQTVKIWSITGERLDTLGQPQGEMLTVRFSPNGNHLFAAGVDRQIRKWQVVSRKEPAINPMLVARFAHEDDVLQIEFAGGDRLISTSVDRTVKLWDTDQLRPLGQLATTTDVPCGILANSTDPIQVVNLIGEVVSIGQEKIVELASVAKRNLRPQIASALQQTLTPALAQTADKTLNPVGESEPNDDFANTARIDLPAQINGIVGMKEGGVADVDLYRFSATAGQKWIIEVNASRSASPLDSRIEILDEYGKGVLQTRLQAMRESYFTFRGKDSDTSDDFRVHNWEDMELNEFLYAGGEIVKLWLYPRGPDSGFKVYPGKGLRYSFFGTTPTSHALGAPAYIVRELVDEEEALPNGLPVFPVYYENDDDGQRRWGKDSRLSFVAPRSGDYFLKICDARGFGGNDYKYTIDIHSPRPDFEIQVKGNKLKMPVGSGREWQVTATRLDDLDSEIAIELKGLPEGFIATNPLVIEAGQQVAVGSIYATTATQSLLDGKPEAEKTKDAPPSTKKIELTLVARSTYHGQVIEHELKDKIEIELNAAPELKVKLVDVHDSSRELEELNIRPGQTITARVVIDRAGVKGSVSFGGDDSGRNLPHGTIVDNIGLNGLLLPDGVNDREFFIKAAKWLPPQRRQIHLRSESKDNPTSKPIWLNVLADQ